ncbi:hypothetical protein FKW77_003294 [Venturia effusa]|uniref:Uncharacterized protein n=1 Tax=Venturia effusa TaxID=50376 RepID=A0A517LIE8_9PEZI|nr:hypothetical protein FKW77_003294 [Venturia effusa]
MGMDESMSAFADRFGKPPSEDNPEAGQGLQACSAELGTYCCKRDYDCCTNSTLVYTLGKPEIVNIIPNHTAHPTQPPPVSPTPIATQGHNVRHSAVLAQNTIIGVGIGFAAAMAIVIFGCSCWLSKRKPSKRYRGRKSGVVEMETLDASRLAIHKELSATSVRQIETPSPRTELDAPTQFELHTRRATIINQVVEMFESDASPNDNEGGADGSITRGSVREMPLWDGTPSPDREAPQIPVLRALPVLTPARSSLRPLGSAPRISQIQMEATAKRPVSEFTPVAGRVPTPLPDLTDSDASGDMPPIPNSPPAIPLPEILTPAISLPEILTARNSSVERVPSAKCDGISPSETGPPQGSQAESEVSSRPGSSGRPSSAMKTTTTETMTVLETTPLERFEARLPTKPRPGGWPLETLAASIHKLETDGSEQSSSAISSEPEAVAEEVEPQVSASSTVVPSPDSTAPQTPLSELPALEQPASPRPTAQRTAHEPASAPD